MMAFLRQPICGHYIWTLVIGCRCFLGTSQLIISKTTEVAKVTTITYKPGALAVSENGLLLSRGLTSRVIAKTDEFVTYKDGSQSAIPFHDQPDAGAVFVDESPTNVGGCAYVSNSEVNSKGGGVGSITFDANGDPIKYEMILTGMLLLSNIYFCTDTFQCIWCISINKCHDNFHLISDILSLFTIYNVVM